MDNIILTENERTVFLKYLIPSMLSMLAVSAYSFVDTFAVGQGIGADAVAAMGLGTPVVSILYALGFLLGSGGAVNYAVKMGSGRRKEARSYFSAAFYAALVLWIILGVGGNLRIEEVARFLGATEGNLALTVEYLRWILSLSGFLVMDLVLNNFMRNEGHPNVSMIATVAGTGLNIVLDLLFVMVFHWGMSGAASATCIASIVSVAINLTCALAAKTNLLPLPDLKSFRNMADIIKIGFGAFVLEGAIAVISVVFLNFAGSRFGDDGVSAFSVLITLNLVVYSLMNGVAQAIQPLISTCYAVSERTRIRRFIRYGLIASLSLGAVFFVLGELFTEFFVRLFVTDSLTIVQMASHGLTLYAISFVFMAVSILLGIYFQAETRPVPSLLILLGRSAALPILILLLLGAVIGDEALWLAIPLGEGAAALLAVVLYRCEQK